MHKKKREYLKRKPTKQIIFTKPFERFLADLTELPIELTQNSNIKYQLNIIAHFSKYGFNYLLENKTSDKIFQCINDCFNKNGVPEELGTDNGTEFCNKKLKAYLESNNVKFVHWKAYNPWSQGCIERLHRTLKIKLICSKLESGDNFDINRENNTIFFNNNNTIHSTTSYKPIEIFYSTSDELFKSVFTNNLNSFKYINTDNTIFKLYENVLLNSNFYIDKKKSKQGKKFLVFNKIKKKKTFIKLCASICDSSDNGFYNIIIEKNYKNYDLAKFDICYLRSELLKKVDEEIWNEIYEEL